MTTTNWLKKKTRGTEGMYRTILFLSAHIGRPVGRSLLYPIVIYFMLRSDDAFRASRDYLTHIRGKKARLWHIFRHYFVFSANVLDRIFFLMGRTRGYRIKLHGHDAIDHVIAGKKGAILLSAHLGSFEVMRSLGREHDLDVKFLLYQEHSETINGMFALLNPEIKDKLINLKNPDAMLRVKEHLDGGGMIAIIGDRTVHDTEKTVSVDFLGKKASLPIGTFILASILEVPVVFIAGLYAGDRKYDIYFELFAEEIKLNRKDRQKDAQVWAQKYAHRMAHYCQKSPYNWFNFYSFWDEDKKDV
ncbi:MAG: LpxL/LpxP family acyltransferase [Alphaproteobacteria bacterium]